MSEIRQLRDTMIPMDKLMTVKDGQTGKFARGILYRDDGFDSFGRPIFTKIAENTVTLGGAVACLERLTGIESSFRPNTLNQILNVNAAGYPYHLMSTPIAMFGCGIGGASSTNYGDVYDPNPKQNNIDQLIPIMVSQNELTGPDASKYMMRTTVETPNKTKLNCWYLKEFDAVPNIRSLWKDAPVENADGSEITSDISGSQSTNGVEAFANFKLVLNDDDLRSYFEAMGMEKMARYNSVGLFLGEKVTITDKPSLGNYQDYVNVSLASVVNINNEPLSERKTITYYYRIYAMI